MPNSNLSNNRRLGTAHTPRPADPSRRRSRRRMTLHHGLLAVALILPSAAWASGPEPANAPDGAAADAPPRGARVGADPPAAGALAPAQSPSGMPAAAGSVRRATLPAGSLPIPAARTAQRGAPAPEPDFLFGQPRLSFGLRGLWHRARAGSEFYDFVNEELFAPRSPDDDHDNPDHGLLNFNAPGISIDFGFGVASRLDVRVGVDYAVSLNESELRNFIGSDGLPYRQNTELSQTELRGELVFALAPRGRAIGQYAWIPSRVVPYVGAGAGLVRYNLSQTGEFVDEFGYFEDTFTSKGWGTGLFLFGGADIRMTRHAFLNAEVRHVEAGAVLSGDFEGFDTLDLGGLRISAGVRFVF
jgi:opacity protein-like surface antigen